MLLYGHCTYLGRAGRDRWIIYALWVLRTFLALSCIVFAIVHQSLHCDWWAQLVSHSELEARLFVPLRHRTQCSSTRAGKSDVRANQFLL